MITTKLMVAAAVLLVLLASPIVICFSLQHASTLPTSYYRYSTGSSTILSSKSSRKSGTSISRSLSRHSRFSSLVLSSLSSNNNNENNNVNNDSIDDNDGASFSLKLKDEIRRIRKERFGTKAKNAAYDASVGDVIIPLVSNLDQRQSLAERGIYAGVEYVIKSLSIEEETTVAEAAAVANNNDNEIIITSDDNDDNKRRIRRNIRSMKDITATDDPRKTNNNNNKQSVVAYVQPAYDLRERLERDDWPVPVVLLKDVPVWISKSTYLAGNAIGTVLLSFTFLLTAAISSFFIKLVAVPSPSMVPALNPGNVVLVTRSLPVISKPKVGDVVFFDSPSELESAIQKYVIEGTSSSSSEPSSNDGDDESTTTMTTNTASTKGKQLLKRVVAVPGESVGVKNSEPYVPLLSSSPPKKYIINEEANQNNIVDNETNNRYRFDIVGPYIKPDLFPNDSWNRLPTQLKNNEYFVAGDNGYRSIDSRVWGPLKSKYITGKVQWILWPINDFGPVPSNEQLQLIEVANKAKTATVGDN